MDDETSPEPIHSDTSQSTKDCSRRMKKWAPKTRTGCLTCRARRVKCDERRPTCYRCQMKNRYCQYESTSRVKPMFRRQSVGSNDEDLGSHPGAVVLSLAPTYGDSESLRYLDVYRSLAAPWLDQYSKASFFDEMLPRLSWHHPALRHALVAVSMASEQYYSGSTVTKPYRRMWHYQQALKHLYTDHYVQEDIMLSACIMFWIHDNIMQDTHNSVIHLRCMLQLVAACESRRAGYCAAVSQLELVVIRSLVYWGHTSNPAFSEGLDTDALSSIHDRLQDPDYGFGLSSATAIREESTLCTTAIQQASSYIACGKDGSTATAIAFDDLISFVHKWYIASINSVIGLSYNDRIILECHHTLLQIVIAIRQNFLGGNNLDLSNDPANTARLLHILNKLESMDLDVLNGDNDKCGLVVPMLPIVAEVSRLTPDTTLIHRASNLLKNFVRTEGFWNSDDVTVLLDTMARTQKYGIHRLPAERVSFVADAMGFGRKHCTPTVSYLHVNG